MPQKSNCAVTLRALRRRGFSVIELLIVILIIGIVISLFLPALLLARDAARRTQCQNNLKQLSLALHNYAEKHFVFPPGVVNETGPIFQEPFGYQISWTVQLLPFLDQTNLSEGWDRAEGAYAPINSRIFQNVVPVFICPANQHPAQRFVEEAQSSYAGCYNDIEAPIDVTNVGVLTLNSSADYETVPDGMSHTIFVGEVRLPGPQVRLKPMDVGPYGLLGWASGTRSTLRNASRFNQDLLPEDFQPGDLTGPVGGFGSYHDRGAHFAFGDGSVRFVHDTVDPQLLMQMANPKDGQLPVGRCLPPSF